MEGTYAAVGWMMRMCQLTQLLEVLHPIVGYTRGPVIPALVQVCFRGTAVEQQSTLVFYGSVAQIIKMFEKAS